MKLETDEIITKEEKIRRRSIIQRSQTIDSKYAEQTLQKLMNSGLFAQKQKIIPPFQKVI